MALDAGVQIGGVTVGERVSGKRHWVERKCGRRYLPKLDKDVEV